MSDDTDHPLADLTASERAIDPPMPEPETPAADRLRAFEDERLGPDAPRFAGQLERGVGSLYSRMSDAAKAHHGKLEKLMATEAKLAEAHAALLKADDDHAAALKAVEDAPPSE